MFLLTIHSLLEKNKSRGFNDIGKKFLDSSKRSDVSGFCNEICLFCDYFLFVFCLTCLFLETDRTIGLRI